MKRSMLVMFLWLSVTMPAKAQSSEWQPKILHASIAASMVAHGADIGSSLYAFGRDPHRYREANPLLRPLSDKPVAFSVAKMSLAVGVNYALLKLHPTYPRATLIASIAQTVVVGYVAHRNAAQLR